MKLKTLQLFQRAGLLSAIAIAVIAVSGLQLQPSSASVPDEAFVYEVLALTNAERNNLGLPSLSIDDKLSAAAKAKAEAMIAEDYFEHTSPDGKEPWQFMTEEGYVYIYAGENLAINYTDPVVLHDAWMRSAPHRANIISPDYSEIGIAAATGDFKGTQTTVVVQMFGLPLSF